VEAGGTVEGGVEAGILVDWSGIVSGGNSPSETITVEAGATVEAAGSVGSGGTVEGAVDAAI
jgi:hypothetical protein